MAITDILQVEIMPDGRSVRLLRPFGDSGHVVPAGFVSDFATIPRIFWRLLPPWGRYSPAAVIHDWLYRVNGVTRKQADVLFLRHMAALKTPWWQRMAIYYGVRAGGWVLWGRYRRADALAK